MSTPVIDVLYFESCPNHHAAHDLVLQVLKEENVTGTIHMVPVETAVDAERHGFAGSPSVRVNGKDVEPDFRTEAVSLRCRIYNVDGRFTGIPDKEWIRQAITESSGT